MGVQVSYSIGGLLDRIKQLDEIAKILQVEEVQRLLQLDVVDLIQVVEEVRNLPPINVETMPALVINSMPSVDIASMPQAEIRGGPAKTFPYARGFRLDVPALPGNYEAIFEPSVDMELTALDVACSGYADLDQWELHLQDEPLFEQMYTKEIPESVPIGNGISVLFIPMGQRLTMRFVNLSGTSKVVWFGLRFLKDPPPPAQ